jgi:hypothetical protein
VALVAKDSAALAVRRAASYALYCAVESYLQMQVQAAQRLAQGSGSGSEAGKSRGRGAYHAQAAAQGAVYGYGEGYEGGNDGPRSARKATARQRTHRLLAAGQGRGAHTPLGVLTTIGAGLRDIYDDTYDDTEGGHGRGGGMGGGMDGDGDGQTMALVMRATDWAARSLHSEPDLHCRVMKLKIVQTALWAFDM